MRRLVPVLAPWFLVACTATVTDDDTVDETTDETGDTTQVVETGLETGIDTDTDGGFEVTFTDTRYRITNLRILPEDKGIDLDGNPGPDNAIATLLGALGLIFPSYGLQGINSNISSAISSNDIVVLFDAKYDAPDLVIDVVNGEEVGGIAYALAESYDEQGKARQMLQGQFVSATEFRTGPDAIVIPFQFDTNEPAILISATNAMSEGEVATGGVSGFLAGAITKTVIVDQIVAPLANDTFGEGSSDATFWINLAGGLVDDAADLTVNDEPALSSAFQFEALEDDWRDPVLTP